MESKKKKYFGEPLLRLVDQKTDLELMYPESKANIKNGVLTWVGIVKTGPFSKEYTIKIEYRIGKSPLTWLVNEKLDSETYMKIPHKYNVDFNAGTIQLCLYKPGNKEWMKHYSIAKTIVPWAIEWLYYYEIWQITGEWQGGGAHPTPKAWRNSDKYKEKIEENKCMRG